MIIFQIQKEETINNIIDNKFFKNFSELTKKFT